MKILAISTSTEACSAAILHDDEIIEEYCLAPQKHAELILAMVDTVLQKADCTLQQLDAIGFDCGPGSFVGVRIATGVTQGLAYGADLPVVSVSSLAAMAQGYAKADQIFVAIDARMKEIYWAAYQRNTQGWVSRVGVESVVAPKLATLPVGWVSTRPSVGIGTGWGAYQDALTERFPVQAFDADVFPAAGQVARLAQQSVIAGKTVSAFAAMPVYLRDQVVKTKS